MESLDKDLLRLILKSLSYLQYELGYDRKYKYSKDADVVDINMKPNSLYDKCTEAIHNIEELISEAEK